MVVWWFVIWAFHLSNTWSHNFLSKCLKLQLHCIPTLQNGLRKRRPKHFKDSRIEHVYKKEPNSLPTGVDRRLIAKFSQAKSRTHAAPSQLGSSAVAWKLSHLFFLHQSGPVQLSRQRAEKDREKPVENGLDHGGVGKFSLSLSLLTCFHRLFVSSAWM